HRSEVDEGEGARPTIEAIKRKGDDRCEGGVKRGHRGNEVYGIRRGASRRREGREKTLGDERGYADHGRKLALFTSEPGRSLGEEEVNGKAGEKRNQERYDVDMKAPAAGTPE